VIIILSGCTTSLKLQTDYDPETEARIRVYGFGPTFLFPGRSCYSANDENIISIKEDPLFVTRQRDIGMLRTGRIAISYHEYVIPANQPLTIVSMQGRGRRSLNWPPSNQASSTSNRTFCGPVAITFIPQPGEDYEAFFGTSWGRNRYCFIQLQHLTQISETHLKVEDVEHENAGLCP